MPTLNRGVVLLRRAALHLLAGEVQRRASIYVGHVNLRPRRQQQLHRLDGPKEHRAVQRRAQLVVVPKGARVASQEGARGKGSQEGARRWAR